jgi:hypothetical protein
MTAVVVRQMPDARKALACRGELAAVQRQAAALAHDRWRGDNPADLIRRVLRRYQREIVSGARPDDISGWVRRTMYELALGDRRADRGQRHHNGELAVLLRQLITPPAHQLRPDLVLRAVAYLHPGDLVILRLRLFSHQNDQIAGRIGATPAAVEQAYRRSRRRLRAVIEHDHELLGHLRALVPSISRRRMRPSRQWPA